MSGGVGLYGLGLDPPPTYETRLTAGHWMNAAYSMALTSTCFIANPLKQLTIGLEEVDDGIWSIHFCNVLLGRIDERDCIIRT